MTSAQSSATPRSSDATVSTIGGRQAVTGCEVEHLLEVETGLARAGSVGLVHDEDVGDLEDPCFVRLHRVTPTGGDDDDGRVGGRGDLDLDLADADGLDEHAARRPAGRENPHHLRGPRSTGPRGARGSPST